MDDRGEGTIETATPGAILKTDHGERTVRVYPILETELANISLMNSFAVAFLTIAGAFGGFSINEFYELYIKSSVPQNAVAGVLGIAITTCVIALMFAGLGIWMLKKRKSAVDHIKSQTPQTFRAS